MHDRVGDIKKELGLFEKPNCDKTGLQLQHTPTGLCAQEGTRSLPSQTLNNRDNISIMACVSGGGNAMPPIVVVEGLFHEAWNLAVTKANILSGFKACVIVPVNPDAILGSASLLASVYDTSLPAETQTIDPSLASSTALTPGCTQPVDTAQTPKTTFTASPPCTVTIDTMTADPSLSSSTALTPECTQPVHTAQTPKTTFIASPPCTIDQELPSLIPLFPELYENSGIVLLACDFEEDAALEINEMGIQTKFLRAARGGDTAEVLKFLGQGVDVNACNESGLTALHLSSKEGIVVMVTSLLEHGADIECTTKRGNSALHLASLAGQTEVVKVLVGWGANPNLQTKSGFTPLYMASQENHVEVVKFLLENGASQTLTTTDGFSPLAVALQQNHSAVVSVLMDNDAISRKLKPALHIAAKKDDLVAAKLLLEQSSVDQQTEDGSTALHMACAYGKDKMAKYLIHHGANVNIKAKNGLTPLHIAAQLDEVNIAQILAENGAEVDVQTQAGYTPLHTACHFGQINMVRFLLDHHASISSTTKMGYTPIHHAAQQTDASIVILLLDNDASPNVLTINDHTALDIAVMLGHSDIIQRLQPVTGRIAQPAGDFAYQIVSPETMEVDKYEDDRPVHNLSTPNKEVVKTELKRDDHRHGRGKNCVMI
ncbi:hypothetical protein ScPMuIL_003521 [Solemya velum]